MNSLAFVTSKLGAVHPKTRSIASEVYNAARAAGHEIWFMWGMGGGKEHGSGYALDLMVHNEAAGDFVRNYLWANRSRLQLRHVIWEQHITSTVVQPGVRRLMADRGSTTENHYDHNHAWFFPGEYVAPPAAGAAKPVARPKPAARPTVTVRTLHRGLTGADVKRLQTGLNRVFPGYPGPKLRTDGSFGPETEKDVRYFQQRAHLKVDGRVGPATRAKLRAYGITL